MLANTIKFDETFHSDALIALRKMNSLFDDLEHLNAQIREQLDDTTGWAGAAHDEYRTLFYQVNNYCSKISSIGNELEDAISIPISNIERFASDEPLVQKIRS